MNTQTKEFIQKPSRDTAKTSETLANLHKQYFVPSSSEAPNTAHAHFELYTNVDYSIRTTTKGNTEAL